MISPRALERRALAILDACGGEPRNWRLALTDPTPEARAAWSAQQMMDALFHAREYMGFIRYARRWSPPRFAHAYTHHRPHQRIARSCIRAAADHLADAERHFANVRMKEAA